MFENAISSGFNLRSTSYFLFKEEYDIVKFYRLHVYCELILCS